VALSAPGRPASQRLDRQAVLGAASALIEREGLAALSMRRLGRELDVQAMALYRYVPGREHLIDWVVDLVVDELYADPEVLLLPTGGWQDYLSRLALRCGGWPWPILTCFPWSPPGRRAPPGCGHRFAAFAGSSRSWPR